MITPQYIAGFFDGEGCITRKDKKHCSIAICVTQTNFEVLDEIKRFFGFGNIREIKKRKLHWKEAWSYDVQDQFQIKQFLVVIEPYLLVKKEKAQKAIEEISNYQEKIEIRKNMAQEARKLRKKGYSLRKIAKEIGSNYQTVKRWVDGSENVRIANL